MAKDTLNLAFQKKDDQERFKLTKEHLDQVRHIEGFPIAEDEDIINLSDPPYYTACPNPFIQDFIDRFGKPYDPENDDYHREPFASDVSEGKNNPIYNAHSYHTKVPHKAIMRYILHYTEPGDIVYDGFCGTGMTGVAAQLCGDKKEVESLGYIVQPDGTILDEKKQPFSKIGARRAVLVDLSPAATFIAYNYNTPVDVAEFEKEAKRILAEVEQECGWMYETRHVVNGKEQLGLDGKPIMGKINYTVWSDVFLCPQCSSELIFWDIAVDKEEGKVRAEFNCPHCNAIFNKKALERAIEHVYDKSLEQTISRARQVPVLINYSVGKQRFEKEPAAYDLDLLSKIERMDVPYWYPTRRMPKGDESRRNDASGITHVHHFYTKRNLWVLSATLKRAQESKHYILWQSILKGSTSYGTRCVKVNVSRLLSKGGLYAFGAVTGTLYIPSLSGERSILAAIYGKVGAVLSVGNFAERAKTIISTHSSSMGINGGSYVDYLFTDPPFGGNLMYSELNFLWEAWLKVFTNNKSEAIENKVQGKGVQEYQALMESCFAEYFRVLKPGRWMTVEFHNSKNQIWNTIQEAINRAGFIIADIRVLDKQQGSFKQVTSSSAVKQDLVISAYKPSEDFENRFALKAGTEDGVWDFVDTHLKQLPTAVEQNGIMEVIGERQNYLLFDRMVAFHIERGIAVPMGAAEFYAGLEQRYPERDGMYFLPEQVAEYDQKRLTVQKVGQLSLFVNDEKAAIQWLRQELNDNPQTFQEIQPKFLQELHIAKYERLPELLELLEENFLRCDEGKWYVPDPNKQTDLEKIRERSLLKEFATYKEGKGKLKEFRTEALRVGFKAFWDKKDYPIIINVAKRIPDSILQEDISLLMYYNNAAIRIEE